MKIALKEAEKAFSRNSVPVGAVIVKNENIICCAGNEVERRQDITAHAEILAIKQASEILRRKYLDDCSIYVTLEPCAMCAQAIAFAHIENLYFGAYDIKYGAVLHGSHVFQSFSFKPNVVGGLLETNCQTLLKEFFKKLR